jgi:hypothetical protein
MQFHIHQNGYNFKNNTNYWKRCTTGTLFWFEFEISPEDSCVKGLVVSWWVFREVTGSWWLQLYQWTNPLTESQFHVLHGDDGHCERWGLVGGSRSLMVCLWRVCLVPGLILSLSLFPGYPEVTALLHHSLQSSCTRSLYPRNNGASDLRTGTSEIMD